MITLTEAAQRLRDARQDVYSGGSKRVNGWAAAADELDRMAEQDRADCRTCAAAPAELADGLRLWHDSGHLHLDKPDGGVFWAVLATAWDQGYSVRAGDQPRDEWPNPYREAVQ